MIKEKNAIYKDILEFSFEYTIDDILTKLLEIMTLSQWYELKESFEEPPEERSDYKEHNTFW